MTVHEIRREMEIHTRARDAAHARFIATGDKAIVATEVAEHALVLVELIRRLEIEMACA